MLDNVCGLPLAGRCRLIICGQFLVMIDVTPTHPNALTSNTPSSSLCVALENVWRAMWIFSRPPLVVRLQLSGPLGVHEGCLTCF